MVTTQYYFLVLDIETSTLYNDEKEPVSVWLSYGYINLYYRDGTRVETNYFREWNELKHILVNYENRFLKKKIICYVHNLGYEFDFLIKNISRPKKFLSNSTHGVISAVLEEYPFIEYRCTYKLTMKSLRNIGNELGFHKLDSEYRFITPTDEVTKEEKEYCIRDCDVVAEYIAKTALPEFQLLTSIPLTKTGRVRNLYNKFYKEYVDRNGEPNWDFYPPENCYDALNNSFAGGVTISNPLFTGIVCKNVVSYDISSSYPFAQLSEEFPYSICKEENPKLEMLKEKFFIAKIKYKNIQSKYNWSWLSISKMQDYNPLKSHWYNGKLVDADFCVRTITNVDYELIKLTYDYSDIEILEFYHCYDYGELPEPYIKTITTLAISKSNAKKEVAQLDEKDPQFLSKMAQYTLIKGDFNSIYGMTVQKIMQDDYTVDDLFVWKTVEKPYKQLQKHLKRNFLFGVYTTAYARRNLIMAILKNCPKTFVYCDTDSIKYIGGTPFTDTNKLLPEKYRDIDGVKGLGRFEKDNEYKEFITYGAKKYAYTLKDDTNVYLTVAGLPKFYGNSCEIYYNDKKIKLNSIYDFKPKTLFKNCKLGKKYMVGDIRFDITDDGHLQVNELDEETKRFLKKHKINTNGGVALYETSYLLDITQTDRDEILNYRKDIKEWVQIYKENSGIDLQEYLNLTHLIDL